ncbi:MAG: universal stress protein, partial [Deltaproteobacteria bacterium]|nr:universal stress protein [Deltaproteobacteria bacterium]
RVGKARREIVREAQELLYDLVVLPSDDEHLLDLCGALLTQVKCPVLLPQSERSSIKKILVCTRGGEPGKGDLRIGARIARHADAMVTVFHVASNDLSAERMDAVERHLEGAQATLRTLRLQHEVKIVRGPAIDRIRAEVAEGDYDLVILGAAPSADGSGPMSARTSALVKQLKIPVLLVPVVD